MEKQRTIEKVDHSEWAAPIVAVPKKDGTFCICGDYKVTMNQTLAVDQYPLNVNHCGTSLSEYIGYQQ